MLIVPNSVYHNHRLVLQLNILFNRQQHTGTDLDLKKITNIKLSILHCGKFNCSLKTFNSLLDAIITFTCLSIVSITIVGVFHPTRQLERFYAEYAIYCKF